MREPHTHCHRCGYPYEHFRAAYGPNEWPRTCGACGGTTWRNPVPVVLAIVPTVGGVLAVRRNIEPGKGGLALPGGYIDWGESWAEAASRELREETTIEVPADAFKFFGLATSTSEDRKVLIFCLCPQVAMPKNFQPNSEVTELVALPGPTELVFSRHTEMLAQFFGGF